MSSEKPENRNSSGSGKPDKNKNPDPPKWHHPSSKTEAGALKAILGKQKKHWAKPKKPDSKQNENEK